MDWIRIAGTVGLLVLLAAVAIAYFLDRVTVNGETDPYQSRPDDHGRETWRSSR